MTSPTRRTLRVQVPPGWDFRKPASSGEGPPQGGPDVAVGFLTGGPVTRDRQLAQQPRVPAVTASSPSAAWDGSGRAMALPVVPGGQGGGAPPVSARMSAAASALELWAVWGRHPLFGAAALPADRGVGPSEDARQLLGAAGQPSDTPTFCSLCVPAWRAQHQKFPVWPRVTPGEAGPLFSPLAPGGATGRL